MKLTDRTEYQHIYTQPGPGKETLSQEDARTKSSRPGQKDQNIPEYLKTPAQREKGQHNASPYGNREVNSLQRAFERAKARKSYDGTSDLMAIANAENEASLRSICIMLSYKLRNLKFSGTDSNTARSSARKIKKVMGKARSKIRKLQKEAELEKKAENARKALKHRLQMEIRRELSLRRKVRKAKERKDVADSYMEAQMEREAEMTSGSVAPDAVFTDLGTSTSASIDLLSVDMALTDTAVAAIAQTDSTGTADMGMGGSIDLAL